MDDWSHPDYVTLTGITLRVCLVNTLLGDSHVPSVTYQGELGQLMLVAPVVVDVVACMCLKS